MEDYFQNMKNLRSQMNDFETEAANVAVEEEKLKTEVKALEEEIESGKSKTKSVKLEMDTMLKIKGQTCSQIGQKTKKITMLETDSSTLSKTQELLEQEKVLLYAKIAEKRDYYVKMKDHMNLKLQEQQDWFNSHKFNKQSEEKTDGLMDKATLKALGIYALEEEEKALMSNKADETEYLQSLKNRIEQIKSVSEIIKCQCGQEYLVEMSQ